MTLAAWLVVTVLSSAASEEAGELPELRLLALSSASGTAVVQVGGVELHTVRTGELLGSTDLVVTEVLPDRLEVVQTVTGEHARAPVRRRLWIHRAEGAKASWVRVLEQTAPTEDRAGRMLAPESPAALPPDATVSPPARKNTSAPAEDPEGPGEPARPPPSSGDPR